MLLAILALNLVLGCIVWLFPQGGIPLGADGEKIKFVSWDQLTGSSESAVVKVNIDSILSAVKPIADIDTSLSDSASTPTVAVDTLPKNRPLYTQAIELPSSNPDALKMLRSGIKEGSKTKVVRILHYGDSQLEGDRITDYIRNKMQLIYGGIGPGILLPKEPTASSRGSMTVSESASIVKKAIYIKKSKADSGSYGIGGASYSITGPSTQFLGWKMLDSALGKVATYAEGKEEVTHPYLNFKNGYLGYSRSKRYKQVSLLYAANSPFEVTMTADGDTQKSTLVPLLGFNKKTWAIAAKKELKLSFTNGEYPNILGVALDGDRGVAVDNFAMRGSSGLGFSTINRSLYRQQLSQMNVCAIVLQYGVNVIPNVRTNYDYYKKGLKRQLKSIKAAYPGVSIIVIGPSDMSRKEDDKMVSYSNIPALRDAMKESALETGCCFWDLYEAMGGQNSMVAWVKKGLAQKDYTHFSYKGAKYVGEMFFSAMQYEINK